MERELDLRELKIDQGVQGVAIGMILGNDLPGLVLFGR